MRETIVIAATDPRTGKTRGHRQDEIQTAVEEPWSLSIEDMVRLTGKTRRWLFTHADELPFVRRVTRKTLVGDAAVLRHWMNNRK
jgi:hypothetical protein